MTNEELVKEYQNGNKTALEELVLCNTGLVHSILCKDMGVSRNQDFYDDMFQAGCMGIMRAAEDYDVQKEVAFSTYAVFWIRSLIDRQSGNLHAIRVPAHLKVTMWKVKRIEEQIKTKQENHSDEEIADLCGISLKKYRQIKMLQMEPASLNAQLDDGDHTGSCMGDLIADTVDAEMEAVNSLYYETLHSELKACLTKEEYDIICRRFGLNGYECMTLKDIGALYGVTRERIRQIEAKCLKKLRNNKKICEGYV